MATIARVEVEWTGTVGLPGVSVLYWDFSANPDLSDLLTFYSTLGDLWPNQLSIQVPSTGDNIDDATGTLNGSWIATGGGAAATTGISQHAAGVGARVRWLTSSIINGRRLAGSTFLCPLATNVYDADGTLTSSAFGTIQTAANTLVTAGGLVVWHRPTAVGASNGSSAAVNAARVPDRVTALRSRRT